VGVAPGNPEEEGEDRDADVEDIPEIIESDDEDEGHGNLGGFPYNMIWNVVDAVDVEPDQPLFELPPFNNGRHRNDTNGHYKREYVGAFHPVNEVDYFQIFMDQTIFQRFVEHTNKYGRRYVKGWTQGITFKDTTINEMKAFFAIIIHSGIVKYPSRDDMFDTSKKGDAFVKSLMSKKRFEQLMNAWHYTDVEGYHQMDRDEQLQFRKDHPFYHAEDLMTTLAEKFMAAWDPGQMLDIDESTCPWKGRHRCRCYNPKKPVKWHFKFFNLNDASNGYCINFYPYLGKSELSKTSRNECNLLSYL